MIFWGEMSTNASALPTSAAPMLPSWMRSAAAGASGRRRVCKGMGGWLEPCAGELAIQERQRTAGGFTGMLLCWHTAAPLPALAPACPCTATHGRTTPAATSRAVPPHPPLLSPQSICFMMRMTPLRDRGVPCSAGGGGEQGQGRQQNSLHMGTTQTGPDEGSGFDG